MSNIAYFVSSNQDENNEKQLLETQDETSIERIYSFWFGQTNLWSKKYNLKAKLWFRRNFNTDKVIKEQFEKLMTEAASSTEPDSLYGRWMQTVRGKIALIILFDQFPRNVYRGTSDMFKYDDKALDISLSILDGTATTDDGSTASNNYVHSYSMPERVFIYFPLQHSEKLEHVERAHRLMGKLTEECLYPNLRKHYIKFTKSANDHVETIRQFKRYPHRNHLLGRESTADELDFLQNAHYNFLKSVEPIDPNAEISKKEDQLGIKQKKSKTDVLIMDPQFASKPKLKLLFLHGYRQNGSILKRTTKKLQGQLSDFATIYYANAPLSIVNNVDDAKSNLLSIIANQSSNQRQWWSPSKDFKVYHHIEASIHYLIQLFKSEGPFDGIIGFSQGAALAGILSAMQEHNQLEFSFKFALLISGFVSRADLHQHIMGTKGSIRLPTLSIYGTQDEMVDNQRTIELSELFTDGQIASHEGSHFSPNKWPYEVIREFILKQYRGGDDIVNIGNGDSGNSLVSNHLHLNPLDPLNGFSEIMDVSLRVKGQSDNLRNSDRVLKLYGLSSNTRKLLENSEQFKSIIDLDNPTLERNQVTHDSVAKLLNQGDKDDKLFLEELLSVVWSVRYSFKSEELRENSLFYYLWLYLYLEKPNQLLEKLNDIIYYGNWRDTVTLAYFSGKLVEQLSTSETKDDEKINHLVKLRRTIVSMYATQLKMDYEIVVGNEQTKSQVQDEVVDQQEENVFKWPSPCAIYAPKLGGGRNGYSSMLAKEISRAMFPLPNLENASEEVVKRSKGLCYSKYRGLVNKLKALFNQTAPGKVDFSANAIDKLTYHQNGAIAMTDQERAELLKSDPSNYVLNPEPEPVVPCSREELDPLLSFMNRDGNLENVPMKFTKGTIIQNGTLDLCKQVVGSEGIKPLLDSMKKSSKIKRLLLGNNIVGDVGAASIADYIKNNKDSKIDTWYIAGNNFDAAAISLIADSLKDDNKVKSLWLKRNPLLTEGVRPIASMLEFNRRITTLDLLNCGILDEGVEILFNSLTLNSTLKNLYIDTNGLTPKSAVTIRKYLESGNNHLDSLYLSCNRLGDTGASEIAQGLLVDKQLKRLGLGSNCIGPLGAKALVDSIIKHPSLQQLNLGFTRATFQLGAINNVLGDEGALEIARLIRANTPIRSIDLVHNGISSVGVSYMRDALRENYMLTSLSLNQFAMNHDDNARKDIIYMLGRNRLKWGKQVLGDDEKNWMKKGDELAEDINTPHHVVEILSVYRTK